MLTFKMKDFNSDINNYLKFIANLEVKTIKCPNCDTSEMERHGYYKRYINISGVKYYIRILSFFYMVCNYFNESSGGTPGLDGNDIIQTTEGMISRTSNPRVHHLNNLSLRII